MNNELTAWADRWNIPYEAITDLLQLNGITSVPQPGKKSEVAIQQRVRLSASAAGVRLWRNNCGVAENPNGQPVRYGLANESTKINRVLKSSDLIGITPVTVTPEHIGQTHGLFTAIEVKKQNWKFSGTDREIAQLRFILLVKSLGGIGEFNNTGEIKR